MGNNLIGSSGRPFKIILESWMFLPTDYYWYNNYNPNKRPKKLNGGILDHIINLEKLRDYDYN